MGFSLSVMGDYWGFIIKRAACDLCITKHLAGVLRVDYRGCKAETKLGDSCRGPGKRWWHLEWQGIGCRGLRSGECAGGLNINSPRLELSG